MLDGYVLPKGTLVTVPSYLVHRQPDAYPEPEEFMPDRWLSDGELCQHRNPLPMLHTPCQGQLVMHFRNHKSGGMHVGMEDGVLHARICEVAVAC